jgi:hypothetical protein
MNEHRIGMRKVGMAVGSKPDDKRKEANRKRTKKVVRHD